MKGDAQAADGELRFGSLRTLVGLGSCRCQKCATQVRVPGGLFSTGSLFRCGGFKILQIGLRTHLVRRFGMVLTCFRLFLNMVLENARPESSLKVPNPLLLTYKHITGRFEGSQARSRGNFDSRLESAQLSSRHDMQGSRQCFFACLAKTATSCNV